MNNGPNGKKRGDVNWGVYVLSLAIENVRCFDQRQLVEFGRKDNPAQWTVILGDNGTGKTTILKVLLGMSPVSVSEKDGSNVIEHKFEWLMCNIGLDEEIVRPRSAGTASSVGMYVLVRRGLDRNAKSSEHDYSDYILLDEPLGQKGILPGGGRLFSSEVGKLAFFVGYGAGRKSGATSLSTEQIPSYRNLFDEKALLLNAEEWLLQADYAAKRVPAPKRVKKVEIIKDVLKRILPDVDEIRIAEANGGLEPRPIVEFHTPYGWVDAGSLSLGYRTSMAWIVDLAARMFERFPESKNPLAEPAVVLIDEIDLHLHPKWQRELIGYLSGLFPNTQFIVTTHSPLIVQSAAAREANIVVCRREGDHVVIDQSIEALKNWRADQILTSDFFGLETARSIDAEMLLLERKRILSQAKLTKKDEKRLMELDQEIGFVPVSENHQDNEAMEIIRNAADWIKSQTKQSHYDLD